jgi:hypothetical protein
LRISDVTWGEKMVGASHNRTRSAKKLLERVKYNLANTEYRGIVIPAGEVCRQVVSTGMTPNFLDNWQEQYPLLKDGVPKEWTNGQ